MLTRSKLKDLRACYSRESIIVILRDTRDYLKAALSPVGLKYRGCPVELDMNDWGSRGPNGQYVVCLAGLWCLLDKGELLDGSHLNSLPLIVEFINSLRFPVLSSSHIRYLLEVNILPYLTEQQAIWDPWDPHMTLSLLDKLLELCATTSQVKDVLYMSDEPMVGADLPAQVRLGNPSMANTVRPGTHYRHDDVRSIYDRINAGGVP